MIKSNLVLVQEKSPYVTGPMIYLTNKTLRKIVLEFLRVIEQLENQFLESKTQR